MKRTGGVAVVVAVLALFSEVGYAQGRSDREWQNNVVFYGLAASISGDARLGPIEQPVDVSFGDILDNLQMGFMGAYRVNNERFSVTADLIYLALGNSKDTRLISRADLDMLVFDVTAGYRFSPVAEVFGGLRVSDFSTKIGRRDPLLPLPNALTEFEGSETMTPSSVLVSSSPWTRSKSGGSRPGATLEASAPQWISPGRPWPMSDSNQRNGFPSGAGFVRSVTTSMMWVSRRDLAWISPITVPSSDSDFTSEASRINRRSAASQ